MHISYMQVKLASTPRGLPVRLHFWSNPGAVQRFHLESGMMIIQHYVEIMIGEPLQTAEYRIAHPAPDYAADYRLHMSESPLNRRLHQEGTSFRAIRAGILAGWARQYLVETDDSVEAIATTLGYQDAANFRRAFRRAEGCSPAAFRHGRQPRTGPQPP